VCVCVLLLWEKSENDEFVNHRHPFSDVHSGVGRLAALFHGTYERFDVSDTLCPYICVCVVGTRAPTVSHPPFLQALLKECP